MLYYIRFNALLSLLHIFKNHYTAALNSKNECLEYTAYKVSNLIMHDNERVDNESVVSVYSPNTGVLK